ncbi:DUF2125 domain-containing protein [Roseivivax sp. GX 12232]|uniref:DUF2125 domain-containing protein n=1 Tax=Roseivivax sp. GX 12232 TaxID=2900547 RepID=UPI001E579A08|nr:DUF2125 domain-containing protein [Roseivivax sp. GX 12232]
MKRLTILVLLLALAWSGVWLWQARALRAEIDDRLAALRAEGWTAGAEEIALRGFPNRLDARFTDLALAPPEGPLWEVPELQVMQLVYNPGHVILAARGEQRISQGDTVYQLASEGLRASLVWQEGALDRANLEAGRLSLTRADLGALHLADLTGALRQGPSDWQAALQASPVSGPEAAPGAARLSADLRLSAEGLPAPHRLTALELSRLAYGDAEGELMLSGPLEFDGKGRAEGALTLTAEGWPALIEGARREGALPPAALSLTENLLSGVAAFQGGGTTLSLPLDIDKGQVKLGPLPLGRLPALPRS